MTLGLAAGVEHREKQQPEKSTRCLQATVPLMRMAGLGTGRVAGSDPAQYGGWHEGDGSSTCAQQEQPPTPAAGKPVSTDGSPLCDHCIFFEI